jgi:hypothetical protein
VAEYAQERVPNPPLRQVDASVGVRRCSALALPVVRALILGSALRDEIQQSSGGFLDEAQDGW